MQSVVRSIVLSLTVAMLSLWALPASAQQTGPYPLSGAIQCDRSVTSPGASVVCTGDGFMPGSSVDVVATGSTVDRAGTSSFAAGTWEFTTTVTADDTGLATATIQVPSDAVGPASVSFMGTAPNNTDRTLRAIGAFTVVVPITTDGLVDDDSVGDDPDAAPATGGGLLSNTGAPFVLGGIAVAGLFLVGAMLLLLGRRRRVRV